MKKAFSFIFSIFFLVSGYFALGFGSVSAQEDTTLICRIFPFLDNVIGGQELCGSADQTQSTAETVEGYIQLALSLIFIAIVIIAIYIIIKAAIKYIRSEGDEDKIQDAQKAIKSVFVGIAALFVGIIGLVLVLAFFQATGAIDDAPDDIGILDEE
jgi:heme/copper-type cytochrome/quinol oxidase subunit 2